MKELGLTEIIVAIIGTLGVVGAAWVTVRGGKKDEPGKPSPEGAAAGAEAPVAAVSATSAIQAASKGGRPPLSKVTVKEIVLVLRDTPPFHRKEIENNYLGLRVRCEAFLSTVTRRADGTFNVSAETSEYDYLSCDAKREDVVDLVSAPERAIVIIEGTLASIGIGYGNLTDCVIVRKSAAEGQRTRETAV